MTPVFAEPDSYLNPDRPHAGLAFRYLQALMAYEHRVASALVEEAVRSGTTIRDLYLRVFEPVQYEIGRLWETNRATVAQEHYCTAATQLIMAQFQGDILATPRLQRFAVVACVGGELHAIGSRMVADFLEMGGWDTLYLGSGTPPAEIARTAAGHRANAVCLSIAMSHQVDAVAEAVRLVKESPAAVGRAAPKVLVGGLPFNRDPELWKQTGADAWAPDAQQAVEQCNRLLLEHSA